MTSCERMMAALRHETTDRTPRFEQLWPETLRLWEGQGLPEGVDWQDHFDLDIRLYSRSNLSLMFDELIVEETDAWQIYFDGNGVKKKRWRQQSGVPHFLGEFAIRNREQWDANKERLTRTTGRVNLEEGKRLVEHYHDAGRFVCWAVSGFWEAARDLLGPELLLMSVVTEPAWIREVIEYYEALVRRLFDEILAAGMAVDALWLWDDLGYGHGPFISPKAYRELIWPAHKRLFEHVHERGRPVILHSCGGIALLVPLLIEAGIDCLQPLQVNAGMDLGALKARYGDRLALMGNVDATVLNTNDREAIRREIQSKLEAGRGGGYVFHSDHSIPPAVTLDTYRFCMELVEDFDRRTNK